VGHAKHGKNPAGKKKGTSRLYCRGKELTQEKGTPKKHFGRQVKSHTEKKKKRQGKRKIKKKTK